MITVALRQEILLHLDGLRDDLLLLLDLRVELGAGTGGSGPFHDGRRDLLVLLLLLLDRLVVVESSGVVSSEKVVPGRVGIAGGREREAEIGSAVSRGARIVGGIAGRGVGGRIGSSVVLLLVLERLGSGGGEPGQLVSTGPGGAGCGSPRSRNVGVVVVVDRTATGGGGSSGGSSSSRSRRSRRRVVGGSRAIGPVARGRMGPAGSVVIGGLLIMMVRSGRRGLARIRTYRRREKNKTKECGQLDDI